MYVTEKVLVEYLELDEYTDKHLEQILLHLKDNDAYIRELVAQLLINFDYNEEAKKALIELACDKDEMVRVEAYDSLSEFEYKEIEEVLKIAMYEESDELARAYAIMSWAEVAKNLNDEYEGHLLIVNELLNNDNIKKSEHCVLECEYARYLFGKEDELENIFTFFNSKDYHIRYATINTLRDIVDKNNRSLIINKIKECIPIEKVRSVRIGMMQFLSDLEQM